MPGMKRLIVPLMFLIFVGVVVYSTLQLRVVSCLVCIEYRGLTECASASGTNEEEARDAAVSVACAQISSGVTESIACSNSPRVREECTQAGGVAEGQPFPP